MTSATQTTIVWHPVMINSTRWRLILSFLAVALLSGSLSMVVGGRLINTAVRNEAITRVRQDLNAAREIYTSRRDTISLVLRVAAMSTELFRAAVDADSSDLADRLQRASAELGLDYYGFVDPQNRIVYASTTETGPVANTCTNPAVAEAVRRKTPVAGTVVLHESTLRASYADLAEQARIEVIPTPRAAPREQTVETRGMTITCAEPVFDGATFLGVLYGGILLNRSEEIVDTVRATVFRGETFRDRVIGTVTIFLEDLRISTNVMTPEGHRAIGTRVSEEVKVAVLDRGERWTDRAFVVNDWYISAYEPIQDIFGTRVGILYVGVLEERYVDIRRYTLGIFLLIAVGGIVVAILAGYLLSHNLLRHIQELVTMSRKVSQGDFSPRIERISRSEIGVLQKTFMEMLSSLAERENRQREESETKLLQSEKQASLGRLAAGVAHEINNPLTGTLTFTHMLLKRNDIDDDVRADLQVIAQSTERVRDIVKGLLDFSRQTKIEPELTDVNDLVKNTIALVENQALVKGVLMCFDPGENVPRRTLDRNQMQGVILNIIMNAIDATEPGGHITVGTALTVSTAQAGHDAAPRRGVEIVIGDTGIGIPAENLKRLFDPFFTTKEVGKGTGLGLSVSLGIVEKHGGTIRVRSTVGRGTTFVVWLPAEELGT